MCTAGHTRGSTSQKEGYETMHRLISLILCSLLFSGCTTCGRYDVALLDVDMRSVEQREADALLRVTPMQPTTGAATTTESFWSILTWPVRELVKIGRGRIRIITIEAQWDDTKPNE